MIKSKTNNKLLFNVEKYQDRQLKSVLANTNPSRNNYRLQRGASARILVDN